MTHRIPPAIFSIILPYLYDSRFKTFATEPLKRLQHWPLLRQNGASGTIIVHLDVIVTGEGKRSMISPSVNILVHKDHP